MKREAIESKQKTNEQWANEAKMIEAQSKQLLMGQNQ